MSFEKLPEGKATLTFDAGKHDVYVKVTTSDGSDAQVEGCNVVTLKSGQEVKLTATGEKVTLKGYITGLECGGNYGDHPLVALDVQGCPALEHLNCTNNNLTSLNLQGLASLSTLVCSYNKLNSLNVKACTALSQFHCYKNNLNASAITELLNALPPLIQEGAWVILYSEKGGEGNCTNFSTPESLKAAFEGAKQKKWTLQKENTAGGVERI